MKRSIFVGALILATTALGCTDMSWKPSPFKSCPTGYTVVMTQDNTCPKGIDCLMADETTMCRQKCEEGYKFVDECEKGISCKHLSDGGICDEQCPQGMRAAADNKCPIDESTGKPVECVTLASGRVCKPGGMPCVGNCQNAGVNCNAGFVTVSEAETKNCSFMEEMTDQEILDFDYNGDNYLCMNGNIAGRYCRKLIDEVSGDYKPQGDTYQGSEFTVLESQICTQEQLNPSTNALRIHIIDVGNGDAIWIQTPDNKNVLIDGGENSNMVPLYAGPIVNDYLEFHGFPRGSSFDAVMLSHPHSDHFGGFPTIFAEGAYLTKNYIDPMDLDTTAIDTASYKTWIKRVKAMIPDTSHIYMPAQEKLGGFGAVMPDEFFGPSVKARYLFSRKNLRGSSSSPNPNSASIFFTLTYGDNPVTMIFGGDGEKEEETAIISEFESTNPDYLKINILKVCHHGSETSSSDAWLDKIYANTESDRRAAVISSGRRKYSGTRTMRPEIVERIRKYVPENNFFSTSAGDDAKEHDKDAVRDDNVLIVVNKDGSFYGCYEGVN